MSGVTIVSKPTPNPRMTQPDTQEFLPLTPKGTQWVCISIDITNFGINTDEPPLFWN
ncbi:hypothetical protein SPRA44_430024 [Serratia proteamaculans]|nr:hypothetical protein SPRA44_430024 [Serratia proteamaculans]